MPFRLPVRRYVQQSTGVTPAKGRFGAVQWILARPLYRFHVIDLAHVPPKSRAAALQLELAQLSPFPRSDTRVLWQVGQALVFAWDADALERAIAAQGLKRRRVDVVPETLLQDRLDNGLRVVATLEGCEGQLWRDRSLTHSTWWREPPTPDQWRMFQRDAGIAPQNQQTIAPAAQALPMQRAPWPGLGNSSVPPSERALIALGIVALAAPSLWLGAQVVKGRAAIDTLDAQRLALQAQAGPLTDARRAALAARSRAEALLALAPYPDQSELMAALAAALPADKSSLTEWDFRHGALKLALTSPGEIASTPLIGALQQAGPFVDIKTLPGRDGKNISLQLRVVPRTADGGVPVAPASVPATAAIEQKTGTAPGRAPARAAAGKP